MDMDAHVCGSCGHPWACHSGYSDTNLCRIPGCCCERSSLNAEKHNNEDARNALAAKDARISQLESDNNALAAEADELESLFDRRWKRDLEAVERWRAAAPGRELSVPDRADLVVFLLDQMTELEGACKPAKPDDAAFREKVRKLVSEMVSSHYTGSHWRALASDILAMLPPASAKI